MAFFRHFRSTRDSRRRQTPTPRGGTGRNGRRLLRAQAADGRPGPLDQRADASRLDPPSLGHRARESRTAGGGDRALGTGGGAQSERRREPRPPDAGLRGGSHPGPHPDRPPRRGGPGPASGTGAGARSARGGCLRELPGGGGRRSCRRAPRSRSAPARFRSSGCESGPPARTGAPRPRGVGSHATTLSGAMRRVRAQPGRKPRYHVS